MTRRNGPTGTGAWLGRPAAAVLALGLLVGCGAQTGARDISSPKTKDPDPAIAMAKSLCDHVGTNVAISNGPAAELEASAEAEDKTCTVRYFGPDAGEGDEQGSVALSYVDREDVDLAGPTLETFVVDGAECAFVTSGERVNGGCGLDDARALSIAVSFPEEGALSPGEEMDVSLVDDVVRPLVEPLLVGARSLLAGSDRQINLDEFVDDSSQTPGDDADGGAEEESPWGRPAGSGKVSVKDSEGRTAQIAIRWFTAETVDPANNPDEDCSVYDGTPPSWEPDKAWLRMHLEADITNTTSGFDWPDGYGGSLTNGGFPGTLPICLYGDASVPSPGNRIWIGSTAMDGATSGITWWASSTKTPNHPAGQFDGVARNWALWRWYFPSATSCSADGILTATLDEQGTCKIAADLSS